MTLKVIDHHSVASIARCLSAYLQESDQRPSTNRYDSVYQLASQPATHLSCKPALLSNPIWISRALFDSCCAAPLKPLIANYFLVDRPKAIFFYTYILLDCYPFGRLIFGMRPPTSIVATKRKSVRPFLNAE